MLSSGIMQRAFVEVILLGLACGPLGVWILLLKRSYAAESLSHAMLPGLVLAALVGVPLVFGAAAGVLVAALGIALVGGDIGVAVVVSGLFGLGGILALSPETPPRLSELLFGDLLGVDRGDLLVAALLTAGVLVALALGYRRLSVAGFETAGKRTDLLLLAILGLTTVAAVQGLGNLLLIALILAPAAAALNLASRLPHVLAISAALAATSGVAGLVVSYELEIAAGASVALCAVATSGLTLLKPRFRHATI
jgi:ABC-type Mn2+/Zn2+ transport system permease subunit